MFRSHLDEVYDACEWGVIIMFVFRWLSLFFSLLMMCPRATVSADPSERGQHKRLDHFVVGLEEFPETLDPRLISFSQLEQSLEHLMFLPLFSSSSDNLPQFILAESARFKNSLLLEIKMRSGIRFANGREIDADDVIATYGSLLGNSSDGPKSPRKNLFANVLSISKASPRTLHVALKSPDASVLSQMTVGVLPKQIVSQIRSDAPSASQLIGLGAESGPFVLSVFGGREFELARNPKYTGAPYGGSFPMATKVRFKLFGSRQAIYDALLSGEVHLVQNSLDAYQLAELRAKHASRFQVQQVVADETWFLGFNFQRKIFNDLRVRRAIALAMDRKEILRFSLLGSGLQAKSIFPPRSYFYPESLENLSQSTREARILLESVGLSASAGQRVTVAEPATPTLFNISVPMEKNRIAIAKALAGQLKVLGINVGIDVSNYATFANKLKSGELDAWIAPWSGFKDGDFLRFALHSQSRPPVGANYGSYVNKELDGILDTALQNPNQTKRKELYDRAQRIIAKDFPYVLLWHGLNFAVSERSFQGFEIFPDARFTTLSSVRSR